MDPRSAENLPEFHSIVHGRLLQQHNIPSLGERIHCSGYQLIVACENRFTTSFGFCLGGDPNGDGTGGESIYGGTFKDEFHSRLRFTRRGLVAMANSGRDDNASQFFFTLGEAMELQNKHTIFGKVTGDTVFNMLKLEEGIVDHNERPMYPHKILKAEILLNPFDDIVPRVAKREEKRERKQKKEKGVK